MNLNDVSQSIAMSLVSETDMQKTCIRGSAVEICTGMLCWYAIGLLNIPWQCALDLQIASPEASPQ